MNKLRIAVLFGGKSPEHEISIISALQVLKALDKKKYDLLPVYVTKEGQWVLGDSSFLKPETFKNLNKIIAGKKKMVLLPQPDLVELVEVSEGLVFLKKMAREKVDVFLPVFHGRLGEDGSIQGLFELADVAYAGCNVQSAAIGMDKVASKLVARGLNIPTTKSIFVTKKEWQENKELTIKKIVGEVALPVYVKPARLGSTIGISRVRNKNLLEQTLAVAFFYDSRVLVEEELKNAREVNISLLGNNPYLCSVCEEPIIRQKILSFEDKYLSDRNTSKGMAGAKRKIPALIKTTTEEKIKNYAQEFFAGIDGKGIARIDFLISQGEEKIYFNEINTMPGSLAFYLWKKSGLAFNQLLDRLIELALENKKEKDALTTTFKSNILANFKGAKGAKA